ncbi:MAG: hypothetical protein WD767_10240 [Alphaproteobacteria bacterium]
MQASISQLVEMAKAARVTDEQREEQRRSFVYGNTAFENENVTREIVDREANRLEADALK